ncbi:MAG: flagellar basal-body rod protein FlgG [Planctomycetia bacterium]|jgi:flagellar basal-body rod protein FlgG|uniref:Flagellar basal-body rod protein FlgG n=1 Tax=Candidatus Brocadia sapporoensis TaxID=392547 RepID=A0A1V6LX96_9BACT|nr:flagellar basal-body rod protein FlgG [Candidatus Brocadia sapporoensis]MCC7238187.1 flagellar basal-body rod protein FlgG [Candidatus Brocadia sp.]MEB2308870.1 flagellar basal-body rod protein FlgG [Candidatus Brocadiaceae bacterium]OQZ04914.1 MAG: flagellar basal-body rod protein FlgG [Candidatus Brocadia sp. UTAMX1]QOJ06667.1 MAG: flagellar basal-body rod protein FlgG [Planctomycetia bacterium]RZV57148.1 MAG: flagellar basal-body rod protein FlgG [Candidatus Brocadia sp. BROELEC01]TVL95
MIRALYTAATGMKAQQLFLDNVSNNLANINTTGFKRSQVNFQDLLYDKKYIAGSESAQGFEIPSGIQLGGGVRPISTSKVFSQGNQQSTGRPLDLSIEGNGFFQISRPDGTIAYTRDGAFELNSKGEIVTAEGLPLTPSVTIQNAKEISIGRDGTVFIKDSNGIIQNVGQIMLANFSNPAGLESLGRNMYAETIASGSPIVSVPGQQGTGEVYQFALENSNVETVTELVNLITAQRAYEINSRAIKASDEMLSTINNLS